MEDREEDERILQSQQWKGKDHMYCRMRVYCR